MDSVINRDKLANTIIYFAERIPDLSKTKLLKLLYLLEEEYVKKYHVPFLDIDYEIWQAGPVNREVYIELSDTPIILNDYIELEYSDDSTIIRAKQAFSDDEFSDNELEVMNIVLSNFGGKTAKELVDYVHKEGSAWHYYAVKTGLLDLFRDKIINSSSEKIDFANFFCNNPSDLLKYNEQKQFNRFIQNFS